jgi:hypothetical protein
MSVIEASRVIGIKVPQERIDETDPNPGFDEYDYLTVMEALAQARIDVTVRQIEAPPGCGYKQLMHFVVNEVQQLTDTL